MDYDQIQKAGYENLIYYVVIAIIWIFSFIRKNQKKISKTQNNAYEETENPAPTPNNLFKDLFNDEKKEVTIDNRPPQPTTRTQQKTTQKTKLTTKTTHNTQKYQQYVDNKAVDTTTKRAENYRIKKVRKNKYKKTLNTKSAVRQAFIASEILNRKF